MDKCKICCCAMQPDALNKDGVCHRCVRLKREREGMLDAKEDGNVRFWVSLTVNQTRLWTSEVDIHLAPLLKEVAEQMENEAFHITTGDDACLAIHCIGMNTTSTHYINLKR